MPSILIKKIPKKNWQEQALKSFKPISLGPFYIFGSHIKTYPENKILLCIDAATAFGSGEHATTQGCLKALIHVKNDFKNALDMGCGSGILSLAYASLTKKSIDSVDMDPESVATTIQNAKKNKINNIHCWQSDGFANIKKKYDLILCNILARPLIEMAFQMKEHLEKNGIAILSGFLLSQEQEVLNAYLNLGFSLEKSYKIKEWGTLVVKKIK